MSSKRSLRPGDYSFAIGTAGSTSLIFQTLMPALMLARSPSTLTIEGGTHNAFAPSFDFLEKAFLPLVNRLGPKINAELERTGFYPAGGGKVRFRIEPAEKLARLDLNQRGEIRTRRATALIAHLPQSIAERELAVVGQMMSWSSDWLHLHQTDNSTGPGNTISIEIACEHVTEVFTGFGERGVVAETVAETVVKEARRYLSTEAALCEHLADQLIIPIALAGGGSFTTCRLSRHTQANIEVIQKFLDVSIETTPLNKRTWQVKVSA
jgi:RNA 3'-terminal phosphate cyclase (ATP)